MAKRSKVKSEADGPSSSTNGPESETAASEPGKKRKLHTYERAWESYHNIQQEKKQKREARELDRQSRTEALARYDADKKQKMKTMYKKTKRGQPKLDLQVEYLLGKLERTIEKEKKNK